MKWRSKFLLLGGLVLCGCGYHWGDPQAICSLYPTLCVPYVQCDQDGRFTTCLVREVVRAGWTYCHGGASATLKVKIKRVSTENIGFQYDTNRAGEKTRRIVPNEGRLYMIAKVELVDPSGRCIVGPTCLRTHVDYDYDPLSTGNELVITSLGQYTAIDEAEETALESLNRAMACKIVDFLIATC